MEWLRQETLDLSGTVYGNFVFFRQFLHTKDSNDILQFCIFLKNFLYFAGCFIMLFAYNVLFQNTGTGFQRINSRVNSLFHNLTGQYRSASRWANVVAGAGSVRSSAGT